MFYPLNNQKGFSLIQVMLFGSIMAAGALVMTRSVTDLKLTQKGIETRDLLETFHATILTALQDSNNCIASYPTMTPYRSAVAAGRRITLANGEVLAQEGQVYMNGNIRLNVIEVQNYTSSGTPPGTITLTYTRLKSDPTNTDKLKAGFGGKDIRKVLPVNFVYDSTATFKSCYLDESRYNSNTAKEFCENLGNGNFMVWDDATSRCVLKQHSCASQPGTVFAGIDSVGQEKCLTITEAINTQNLFNTGQITCTGRQFLRLAVVGGKIQIFCEN